MRNDGKEMGKNNGETMRNYKKKLSKKRIENLLKLC